jgi:two-component system sensor histidine kinase SenX3
VTTDETRLLAAVIALGVVLLLFLFVWWRSRRTLVRRVADAALRLEHTHTRDQRRLEPSLARLERAIDRTVLRANDTELARSRLLQAVQAIPQGVVIADEQGHGVYRNDVAESYLTGRHSDALVAAAVDEMVVAALGGLSDRRTLDLFGPPRRTLVIASFPLEDGRRTVGALAVIDDISERRRLEAVRRDFVANISHELKTPVGALGLLAETLAEEDDHSVSRRLAERMLQEAIRVGRTIDDLLELSRIEAEEPHPREAVPVHLVVAEAVERVRPAAEQRRTPIDVAEPPHHFSIVGDRRQLVSAVYNLLENATKYSDAGSTIEVATVLHSGHIEISVRDHGIGIPARDLERIFERFYRVDRARSRETGGTGLGLAIVRHVAANHSGECRVVSREGEGSRFTLSFPAGPGSASLPSTEAG